MRKFYGVIAYVATPTIEGYPRLIEQGALDLDPDCEYPVVNGIEPEHGRLIGVMTAAIEGNEVRATGQVDLPPGVYSGGVDLTFTESGARHDGTMLVLSKAKLLGFTVHSRPVWVGVRITVEDDDGAA